MNGLFIRDQTVQLSRGKINNLLQFANFYWQSIFSRQNCQI